MRILMMYWFVSVICVVLSIGSDYVSEARMEKKLPSAIIVGTVYCDTCFQAQIPNPSHLIAGAVVGVECQGTRSNPSFRKELKTNANGEFRLHLPFSVSKHLEKIKGCSVKLIRSSEPYCAIASTATQSTLHLKSKTRKTHIFSAGYLTFKPNNQPSLCNQKPTMNFNSRKSLPQIPNDRGFPDLPSTPNDPGFSSPPLAPNPRIPILPPTDGNFFPPLPTLPRLPPLPQLPSLPTLPGLPLLPPLKEKPTDTIKNPKFSNDDMAASQLPTISSPPPAFGFQFPPFSFRPPALILPPNPSQPSPQSVPIPLILNPPPPQLPMLDLNPSPPQLPTPELNPSPPLFSNPLPPFPFQPSQGFPGLPPAFSVDKRSP